MKVSVAIVFTFIISRLTFPAPIMNYPICHTFAAMKRIFLLGFAVALVLISSSWGQKGHQVVAKIAENHLSPKAKSEIVNLLGDNSLADIATWADEVRNDPAYRKTAPWHYLNLSLGLNFTQFSETVNAQGGNNIYQATADARNTLLNANGTKEEKVEALKFLVHFVGDAHQPMHISRAEDKGGNSIQVRFDDKGTNLHSLWDSKLIDHQGESVTEMTAKYDKATPAEIKQWQQDQPMQWLFESYQISSKLYAEVETSNKLDEDYYSSHIGTVEKRIDQGGIRLAGLLNAIFNGKNSNNTTVSTPVAKKETNSETQGSVKAVTLNDIASHLNETVEVTAKVYGTKDFGSMVLVNLGAAYPNSPLTIVLRNEAKSLASKLENKTITVQGKVIDYKGKPEIVVTDGNQINIK
jgi:DNA/RNA endonuclease YhcR with UshA esterase domain